MATYLSGLNAPAAISGHQQRRPVITCHASSQPAATIRRSSCLRLGLAAATAVLLEQQAPPPARAADDDADEEPANNGWWLTEFPLPVRKIRNKEINNAETGTRSFLKNGIFMADIGPSFAAHAYRLRSTAFDLLALEDLLGKDASNYVNKYLRLKATFMYYDFDKLITAVADDDKQPYVDLANRLFDSFENMQQAVTAKDDTNISERYADTKVILQELMARMA
ncbi:hypothetical protein PR202_ga28664 [Eleusine coracana subsp. coracana]|uniref:Photosynthetic NDH subcomplex L 3 n=1 Tax=Eleusine coracana subsp. coracana TaxID=191504 RepID=A0AAV5DHQ2_ELECO|nr:hypothetical protein QOZ80_7AG0552410 [Eleusine coracana subsp. coracana]GJN10559.1 hypothetical protein PR202_ga28664 [Eleusine coracana subsp. coracana]